MFFTKQQLNQNEPYTRPDRAPWVEAVTIGLLHGLGFASALNEVGFAAQQAIPVRAALGGTGPASGHCRFACGHGG
jgi:hypothetical protein